MSFTIQKTTPECSNVLMIDATSCLADSVEILNKNTTYIDLGITDLENYVNNINSQFLSYFYSISADMINTMINIKNADKNYINAYTVLQQTSALYVVKEFSVYYPEFVDLRSYVTVTPYRDAINANIYNWLSQNFPNDNYLPGQIVHCFLTFKLQNPFNYEFHGDYLENCGPTGHSANTLSCAGCGAISKFAGCNHDAHGAHWCDNAYSYCQTTFISDTETYTCQGRVTTTFQSYTRNTKDPVVYYTSDDGQLKIDYIWDGNVLTDNFVARILKVSFQSKDNGYGIYQWSLIQ